MAERETWYVLEDGSCADPREVVRDAEGRLHHRDGRAVAYAPHGPRSRSVDPEAMRAATPQPAPEPAARTVVAAEPDPPVADRQMKPATGVRTYRTRAGKAD